MSITYDPQEFKIIGTTLVKYTGYSNVVTVPEGITIIGEYAFFGCKSLTAVNLPQSITTIRGPAFSQCWSLTTVNLPSSLTTIGEYAFSHCTFLTTINLPPYLTTIGKEAFRNCKSLKIIVSNPHHKKLLKDSGYTGKIILVPLLFDTTQQNPKHPTPESTTQIFK